jgi:hypothetical protein
LLLDEQGLTLGARGLVALAAYLDGSGETRGNATGRSHIHWYVVGIRKKPHYELLALVTGRNFFYSEFDVCCHVVYVYLRRFDVLEQLHGVG